MLPRGGLSHVDSAAELLLTSRLVVSGGPKGARESPLRLTWFRGLRVEAVLLLACDAAPQEDPETSSTISHLG